jgi:hypothetical protein
VVAVLLDPLEHRLGRAGGLGHGLGQAVGVGDVAEVLRARHGGGHGVVVPPDLGRRVHVQALAGIQGLSLVHAQRGDDGVGLFALVDVLALEMDGVDLAVVAAQRPDLGQAPGAVDVAGRDPLGVAVHAVGHGQHLAGALQPADALEPAGLEAHRQPL